MAEQDHRKFHEQFVRNQSRIYGYVCTLLPIRSDAEEVFQETSVLLWEKWSEFDPSRDFVRWGCGVARNVARNFARKHRHNRVLLDEEAVNMLSEVCLKSQDVLEARRSALARCMTLLKEAEQRLLERCYCQSGTIRGVAEELHISANAVSMRLCRLRRTLFECINRAIAGGGHE